MHCVENENFLLIISGTSRRARAHRLHRGAVGARLARSGCRYTCFQRAHRGGRTRDSNEQWPRRIDCSGADSLQAKTKAQINTELRHGNGKMTPLLVRNGVAVGKGTTVTASLLPVRCSNCDWSGDDVDSPGAIADGDAAGNSDAPQRRKLEISAPPLSFSYPGKMLGESTRRRGSGKMLVFQFIQLFLVTSLTLMLNNS